MCQMYDLFLVIHIHAGRGSCFVKSVRGLRMGSKAMITLEEAYPSSFSIDFSVLCCICNCFLYCFSVKRRMVSIQCVESFFLPAKLTA